MPLCEYKGCPTNQRTPQRKLFSFPVNNKTALAKWLSVCDTVRSSIMTPKRIRNCRLCDLHFDQSDIKTSGKLKYGAVPKALPALKVNVDVSPECLSVLGCNKQRHTYSSTLSDGFDMNTPDTGPSRSTSGSTKRFSVSPWKITSLKSTVRRELFPSSPDKTEVNVVVDEDNGGMPQTLFGSPWKVSTLNEAIPSVTSTCAQEPSTSQGVGESKVISTLKLKLRNSQKKANYFKTSLTQARKDIKNIKSLVAEALHRYEFPSVSSKAIAKMQFRRKQTPWSVPERNLALSTYFKSSGCYTMLRRRGVILPAPSTIKSWLAKFNCFPGLNKKFLAAFKLKVEGMEQNEKLCSICVDEMSIKKLLEYNRNFDFIEGYVDLGWERRKEIAGNVLVFLLRGLMHSWKIPFLYLLVPSGGLGNLDLKRATESVVKTILQIGLHPVAFVCDQGPHNQSFLSHMGSTSSNPSFVVAGKKLHAIYDAPHLIKSVRNNFLKSKFILNDKVVANFKDVLTVYNIDRIRGSSTAKAMPRITDIHIYPNGRQKMRVRLAVQLLSASVAATLRTAVATKELTSATGLETAKFVGFMNDLFDALNSRKLFSPNRNANALSQSSPWIRERLEAAITFFSGVNKKSITGEQIHRRPACFDGIVWTCRSILNLFQELPGSDDTKFILTSRLNQDPLENLFAVLRQKGGFNSNPSARTIRSTFRNIAISSMMTPVSANCEQDDDNVLAVEEAEETMMQEISYIEAAPESSDDEDDPDAETDVIAKDFKSYMKSKTSTPSLSSNAVNYFAGYILYRCPCGDCKSRFQDPNPSDYNIHQTLIEEKEFRGASYRDLTYANETFVNITRSALRTLDNNWKDISHKKELLSSILQSALPIALEFCGDIPQKCHGHIREMLHLLLRTKVYKFLKWEKIRDSVLEREKMSRIKRS